MIAAVEISVNGLMRAAESFWQVVTDGFVPVTVQLICKYEAERMIFHQFGWYRRIIQSCPYLGDRTFLFLEYGEKAMFILAHRWRRYRAKAI